MGAVSIYSKIARCLDRYWKKSGLVTAVIVAVLLGIGGPLRAYAADGDLDNSFSGDGMQTTDFAGETDGANSVALQSDGKIVLGGYTFVLDVATRRGFGERRSRPL